MEEKTNDRIRESVCKITGWTPPPPLSTLCGWMRGDVKMLSDPLDDLNACVEFEKMLTLQQRNQYADELFRLLPPSAQDSYAPVWSATAEQRCRAFVATMEASSPNPSGNERSDGSLPTKSI